jgi:hypothetical protein
MDYSSTPLTKTPEYRKAAGRENKPAPTQNLKISMALCGPLNSTQKMVSFCMPQQH